VKGGKCKAESRLVQSVHVEPWTADRREGEVTAAVLQVLKQVEEELCG
jgi:hypothetical protein